MRGILLYPVKQNGANPSQSQIAGSTTSRFDQCNVQVRQQVDLTSATQSNRHGCPAADAYASCEGILRLRQESYRTAVFFIEFLRILWYNCGQRTDRCARLFLSRPAGFFCLPKKEMDMKQPDFLAKLILIHRAI